MTLEATGFVHSVDVLLPEYPQGPYQQAEQWLYSPVPAWELTDAGIVLRATPQVLLVWGAINLDNETIEKEKVLGRNAFDIFASNLSRLNLPENDNFWKIKSSVFWRFFRYHKKMPSVSFVEAMMSSEHLETIFRTAPRISGAEWEYEVTMIRPPGTEPVEPLKFRTEIVVVPKFDTGFRLFACYHPLGGTEGFLEDMSGQLGALCGTMPLTCSLTKGGEPPLKERQSQTRREIASMTADQFPFANYREEKLGMAEQKSLVDRGTGKPTELSDGAHQVLTLAELEARQYNCCNVDTEHLLLALARDTTLHDVFASLGISLSHLRRGVEFLRDPSDEHCHQSNREKLELTNQANTAMALAAKDAQQKGATEITPAHILDGIYTLGEGVAFGVLEAMCITPRVVNEILKHKEHLGLSA